MKKIVNYIWSGKGNGLLFLLATAVLMAIVVLFVFKFAYVDGLRPKVLSAVGEILPITIENGRVVQPVDSYKRVDISLETWNGNAFVFPIVLDTKSVESTLPQEKLGLFVFKDLAYLITPQEIKKMHLDDNVWNLEFVTEFLDYMFNALSFMFSIVYIGVSFVFVLLKTLVVAVVNRFLVQRLEKSNEFEFGVYMRLAAISVSLMELFMLGLKFITGVVVGNVSQVILLIVLTYLYISRRVKVQD